MQARFIAIATFVVALFLGGVPVAFAQQTPATPQDTLRPVPPPVEVEEQQFEQIDVTAEEAASLPDPRKSAFLSAILPGLGQTYNGALWKVPLVYAGAAGFIYGVNFYNLRYSESRKMLRQLIYEADGSAQATADRERYERAVDFYRRQRDYLIILSGAYYGLQIVEAYVDAQLQTFSLDEELSMRVRPTLVPSPAGTLAPGLRITYTFP
ncbi:DUF5683 domain-containing protein [Cesiribacter sp. SM1]|uniref:DUF5683 domain-containing protein n=1 Tax=Cesiribacter sp. SM1 TaxID=2861196 RepID=UPI001CD2DF11|nr:DUF5683 domain-containing protein [Cesiribacter sp. SM1]